MISDMAVAAGAAVGFNEAQVTFMDGMVREGMASIGKDAAQEVERAKEQTREALREMEEFYNTKNNEITQTTSGIATQQANIVEFLKTAEDKNAAMQASLAEKEQQIRTLLEGLTQHETVKQHIIRGIG